MTCSFSMGKAASAPLALMLTTLVLAVLANPAHATDFERDVLPLLQTHCLACHGEDLAEAGLRLDQPQFALRGGDSGEPSIVPGDAAASYLYQRVTHADDAQRMPPDSPPLADDELQILRQWLESTEYWTHVHDSIGAEPLTHWSFQPLKPVAVPDVDVAARNPIDRFIQAGLTEQQLVPSPQASPHRLIRRLFLVLHGLPPTPEQAERFVAAWQATHSDPAQRERLWQTWTDDLLDHHHFAERFASHWLDLIRFGESNGFETNRERPDAWPFRDWVINAFDQDLPYDQFICQQLAGDALGTDVATGFLVAGPHDIVKGENPLLGLTQRQDDLADIIHTTGTAFLGLTFGCARCHNHKFDPVSQSDYYALQAVFAGVQHDGREIRLSPADQAELLAIDRQIEQLWEPGQRRPAVDARLNREWFPPADVRQLRLVIGSANQGEPCIDEWEVFSGDTNVALAAHGTIATSSGDFVHPLHQLSHIHDGQVGNPRSWIADRATDVWVQLEFPAVTRIDLIRWGRDRQGQYADRLMTDYRFEGSLDGQTWTVLASSVDRRPPVGGPAGERVGELAAVSAGFPPDRREPWETLHQRRLQLAATQTAYIGSFQQPEPTPRLYRGDPLSPRERVSPGGVQALQAWSLPIDSPEQQRRLRLAQWIASADNPLTARVIVNRIWQFHFGTGLVDTANDFGLGGNPPSHPELLDWLAQELIRSGWSLKHIHRLILQSDSWRQDSRPRESAMAVDAGSRWLWRFPPRRLDAEAIRDSVLVASDSLDRRRGGPGFRGFAVDPENVYHYHPKESYGPEDWRRMIYMNRVRQERESVFGVFDCPDFTQVVARRNRSTTPLQALSLMNSGFMMQQSERLAARLLQPPGQSDEQRIARAYQICFQRPVEAHELATAAPFVQQWGWPALARAMLNSNELVWLP